MITTDDIRKEIESMDEVRNELKNPYEKSMLKSQTLIIKLLKDIRANQVIDMTARGVQLKESKFQKKEEK